MILVIGDCHIQNRFINFVITNLWDGRAVRYLWYQTRGYQLVGPSQPIIGRAQQMKVGLFFSKVRFMELMMSTWEEPKVPIQGLFLPRRISPRLLSHMAGPTGAVRAAQSKTHFLFNLARQHDHMTKYLTNYIDFCYIVFIYPNNVLYSVWWHHPY